MTSNARLRPQASENMLMIPQFPKRHTEMKRAPSRKISNNWLQLNSKKCKEMRVSFLRQEPSYSPLTVNNCALEVVSSHKVLGVTIQNDLKWGTHIENIIKKASKRLHILRILKRASVPPQDLLVIYASLVRSVLEYCCPVWHNNLPQYLSDLVERVQKRAFAELKSMSLSERRGELCKKTIKKIVKGTCLSHLLPTTRVCAHCRDLRNGNNRSSFSCRTNRFKNSFFPSMINHLNIS